MSERNWPLLIRVGMQIVEHPETWNQDIWANSCGTQFCFAGHAVVLSGHTFAIDPRDGNLLERVPATQLPEMKPYSWPSTVAGIDVLDPDDAARHLLGLSEGNAAALFDYENTLSDLLGYLNLWARADGVSLPEPLKLTTYQLAAWERDYVPSRDD